MSNDIDLSSLSRQDGIHLLELLNEYDDRLRYRKLDMWFPKTGPYRRDLYPKHMDFIRAGASIMERLFIAGNQVGKSTVAAWESAYHLTGRYPDDWEGKRYFEPISMIAIGRSHQQVRDVAQFILCGHIYDIGTGMIPKADFHMTGCKVKSGVPNALSQIMVKHYTDGVFDGYSICDFFSYEQGREVLQGTVRHHIWEDEENPDINIHTELLTRLITTDGTSVTTFTPLNGLTEVVLSFLPGARFPVHNIIRTKEGTEKYITRVEWDDVPHLSDKAKRDMLARYPSHMREARSRGIPSVGSGKIYPISEEDIQVEPFQIPHTWKRFYGMDIPFTPGGRFACVWFAYDEYSDTLYITDAYRASEQMPAVHAMAVRRRGDWIKGVIDPSALKNNSSGIQHLKQFQELGLKIVIANNAVEPGIMAVMQRFSEGRLKVFTSCALWWEEYRLYRYDLKGRVAREQVDDLMDATRYGVMSGFRVAEAMPLDEEDESNEQRKRVKAMNRNPITGY